LPHFDDVGPTGIQARFRILSQTAIQGSDAPFFVFVF
jgi:hypothetical protein